MYEFLIPILIGVTILVVSFTLMNNALRNDSKEIMQKRIERCSGASKTAYDFENSSNQIGSYDDEKISSIRLKLFKAGWRASWAPVAFWAFRGAMALAGVIAVFGLTVRYPGMMSINGIRILQLAAALLGFLLPSFLLDYKIKARKQAITWELPEVLDLLVVCVEAGMGLEQGISRVTQEISLSCPVLHSEFKQMSLELFAGKGRAEAFRTLAKRVGIVDLDNLVTMLIQADTLGTSVSQTLRVYSDSLRTKRFQRAEEMASKLPVKLLIPVIFFIFPMLLIVIIGPASIRISEMFQK